MSLPSNFVFPCPLSRGPGPATRHRDTEKEWGRNAEISLKIRCFYLEVIWHSDFLPMVRRRSKVEHRRSLSVRRRFESAFKLVFSAARFLPPWRRRVLLTLESALSHLENPAANLGRPSHHPPTRAPHASSPLAQPARGIYTVCSPRCPLNGCGFL